MDLSLLGQSMVPVGAIIAAVIAGALAYSNLITAKEQKVSEFRQQWINALRDSIAEYLAALAYISLREQQGQQGTGAEGAGETLRETYLTLDKAYNDIVFRINDRERDEAGRLINDTFLRALAKTRERHQRGEHAGVTEACGEVREAAKAVLKFEWERVKRGEPAYEQTKRWARGFLFTGIGIALLWVLIGLVAQPSQEAAAPPRVNAPAPYGERPAPWWWSGPRGGAPGFRHWR